MSHAASRLVVANFQLQIENPEGVKEVVGREGQQHEAFNGMGVALIMSCSIATPEYAVG